MSTAPTIAEQIESATASMNAAKARLDEIEADYQSLRAQFAFYQQHVKNLRKLEEGKYKVNEEGDAAPAVRRRGSSQLKDMVYEYFKAHPLMLQSPKGVCDWLVSNKNVADDEGLRTRVSNLLRKIVKEEAWLQNVGHGKYQFKSNK